MFADAHSSLAVLLEEQGRYDEAEMSYHKAISLRPDDPNLHNNLAVFLTNKGWHSLGIYITECLMQPKCHVIILKEFL